MLIHKNTAPSFLEKRFIKYENNNILSATAVVTLFPYSCNYINDTLNINSAHYLGNVLNSTRVPDISSIKYKEKNRKILFIGRENYLEGAIKLLLSFDRIAKHDRSITLDIIGLDKHHFASIPPRVNFHGYLNKSIEAESDLYYSLIENASLIVNPTPRWSSFSSILEAMFFYTPVISTKTEEMVSTFSDELSFGYYYESDKKLDFQILDILNNDDYRKLALNAHKSVSNFTWANFTKRLLLLMQEDSPS